MFAARIHDERGEDAVFMLRIYENCGRTFFIATQILLVQQMIQILF